MYPCNFSRSIQRCVNHGEISSPCISTCRTHAISPLPDPTAQQRLVISTISRHLCTLRDASFTDMPKDHGIAFADLVDAAGHRPISHAARMLFPVHSLDLRILHLLHIIAISKHTLTKTVSYGALWCIRSCTATKRAMVITTESCTFMRIL